jgi:hypothetical protein
VPVDKYPDIQFRTLPFCRIESVKYAFTTVILSAIMQIRRVALAIFSSRVSLKLAGA